MMGLTVSGKEGIKRGLEQRAQTTSARDLPPQNPQKDATS